MGADNATNQARQREAEARVQAAVDALQQRGEPLGLRALAREAGASLSTVRKLRHRWQSTAPASVDTVAETTDASWGERLAVFHPHTVTDYLQSIWLEPVTIDTFARWYVEMTLLRRLYGSRTIHLAPATYRLYADWMNVVLEEAGQQYPPQALAAAVARWHGDPIAAVLADGAMAGVHLPKAVKDTLLAVSQQGVPTNVEGGTTAVPTC